MEIQRTFLFPLSPARATLALLVICCAFFWLSCGGGSESAKGTLYLYEPKNPTTLDPACSWGVFDGRVCSMIFSGLIRLDENGQVVTDLADGLSVSEDQTRFQFVLKEGIHFANGDPITAYDVKYSLERVLHPDTQSTTTWVLEKILGAKGYTEAQAAIKAGASHDEIDPVFLEGVPGIEIYEISGHQVLNIRLNEPFAPFLSLLAMPAAAIVSATDVREAKEAGRSFEENPVGAGPWKLDHWTRDKEIVLVRNDKYWDELPKLEKIVFRIIPTDANAVSEFETGGLDVLNVPLPEVPLWRQKTQDKAILHEIQQLHLFFLAFNTTRKPFDDLRVRKAMVHAADIGLILKTIREDLGIQAKGAIPPGLLGYDEERQPFPHDPELARTLLQEAGYANGFECEILYTSPDTRPVLEALQAQFSKVGISVRLNRAEWSTYRELRNQNNYDIAYYEWYADYPDPDNFLFPLFHSSQNKRYRNAEVDNIIETARNLPDETTAHFIDIMLMRNPKLVEVTREKAVVDAKERERLYQLADRLLYEDCPAIFMWHRKILQAVNPRVEGYREPLTFNGTRFMEVETG